MIQDIIGKLIERRDLTEEESAAAMTCVMDGEATPAQIAGLLVGLRMKGETPDEITGFVRVMRDKAVRIKPKRYPLADTCGTGGDRVKTFNVSTAAAFVVAGAGVAVAKHGNRSVTSKCGSADVLEALDITLEMEPEDVSRCIDEVGIGFMFAPRFHPAMKHAAPVRRELGVRTVFNLLGPLTNPAGATAQVLGVPGPEWAEPLARVLANLGAERAFVVHGACGVDEISTAGETLVHEVRDGEVNSYSIRPEEFGLTCAEPESISGGDAAENARTLVGILEGNAGPKRDIVLLNAAAAIAAGGAAADLAEGLSVATEAIDSGAALARLREMQAFCAARKTTQ
ncbi:MAG: anthranilate phosphoribosyltransferase [Armatimonadota bacterium]|nr:MAG: anthranilate phosphoribosyltransferase [Armatimonadota bacterium]